MHGGRASLNYKALLVGDRIPQHAHTLYANLNHISRDHRAHALRGAGCNQVSGKQGHRLRNVAQDGAERKNNLPRVALLAHISVHSSFNSDSSPWIDFIRHQRATWAKSIEAFGASPLAVGVLQVTSRDIVDARITKNVGTGIALIPQL